MKIRSAAILPLLALGLPALAQEETPTPKSAREKEIDELLALRKRIDAALAALQRVERKTYSFVQYDLRHLLYRPVDRRAPRLAVPGESAGRRTGAGEGGLLFFDQGAEDDCDLLSELEERIVLAVGEDAWDEPASLRLQNGYAYVVQTPLGHARVRRLLEGLLRERARTVALEVGFYSLAETLERRLEDAALAGGGVLPATLLAEIDRSVARGESVRGRLALLSALDRQRVFLHHGSERSLVTGFEQISGGTGQTVAVVTDPVVGVLHTGFGLEARATILAAEGTPEVALDVRLSRLRTSGVASEATPWGRVDVPRAQVESVRTNARVPAGAGMLVFSSREGAGEGAESFAVVVRPRVLEP
ncbi:MAG: hypothetical protein D6731_12905 [Planctomycetota bacterium]|nr:MAG: hypothetical protein D6731_12905 [Planctomycetota bacterium]